MLPVSVTWREGELFLLDQRVIPWETSWVRCSSVLEVAESITNMTVRGAPAIGIAAAYGMVLAVYAGEDLKKASQLLMASRPTAVNLRWALDRMEGALSGGVDLRKVALLEARNIEEEDRDINVAIGNNGAELIPDNSVILTHCNAGALATGGWGTALGVIRSAVKQGKSVKVYADETRPRLQGSRLTAWELSKDGIDVTVICDNMAAWLMKNKKVDAVIVGADRIALNGDTANKIGTYALSIVAKFHGVPFYVAAPLSTFDRKIPDGSFIPIEERSPDEVRSFGSVEVIPDYIKVWNPAFDVTPFDNISGIITEAGVFSPPYTPRIKKALKWTDADK